jgi:hypothetical protein
MRTKVVNLAPLTKKQADWLFKQGIAFASKKPKHLDDPFFVPYFGLKEDAYENPYADVSNPVAWIAFKTALEHNLKLASRDRSVWLDLYRDGGLPPDPVPSRPYDLPPYFDWWQAENAFRRGYVARFEEALTNGLKSDIKYYVNRDGGVITEDAARSIAKNYEEDLVVAAFFNELADELNADPDTSKYPTLRDLIAAMQQRRAVAYQQFSPEYMPLISRGGGGFFGLKKK